MLGELLKIVGQCDGVRCDMAMLVLPEVFERTWGIPGSLFWPQATCAGAAPTSLHGRGLSDLEWTSQQQGFDYTYDGYDRLRDGHTRPLREHFTPSSITQLARFLENHDEPRAAAAFPPGVHEAAAVITSVPRVALAPGTIPGAPETHLAPSGPRPGRTHRPASGTVLRPAADRTPPSSGAPRPVAIARMRPRLGRQLDLGLLPGLCLARSRCRSICW